MIYCIGCNILIVSCTIQTHECGNWDCWGHAIPFLGIPKWDFRCSVRIPGKWLDVWAGGEGRGWAWAGCWWAGPGGHAPFPASHRINHSYRTVTDYFFLYNKEFSVLHTTFSQIINITVIDELWQNYLFFSVFSYYSGVNFFNKIDSVFISGIHCWARAYYDW